MKTLALVATIVGAALGFAPAAQAQMPAGNWDLRIQGRYDFHTWLWAVQPCAGSAADCLLVSGIPQPVAKAFAYTGNAYLADGRYSMTVDVPDGLRCGNVYYGPVIPTRDTYSWDATTMVGSLESSFAAGCDGAPGGTFTYPFTMVRW